MNVAFSAAFAISFHHLLRTFISHCFYVVVLFPCIAVAMWLS